MNKRNFLLGGAVVVVVAIYLLATPSESSKFALAQHAGMVVDNSTSQSIDCNSLPSIARKGLEGMDIGKHSHFTIFKLGSEVSSWEPVMVYDGAAPRKSGSVMGAGSFDENLKRVCAGFTPVNSSSIYRAVQLALNHLHGEGCGETLPGCRLTVISDGEENVSEIFRKAGKKVAPSLDDNGITVSWCGYGVTDGGRGPRGEYADALLNKWRRLFTNPENVTFKPFCAATPTGTQTAAVQ